MIGKILLFTSIKCALLASFTPNLNSRRFNRNLTKPNLTQCSVQSSNEPHAHFTQNSFINGKKFE